MHTSRSYLVIGASGTIAHWVDAGIEVTYCVITDGDAGGFDPAVPRSEIPRIRRAEQVAAAVVFEDGVARKSDYRHFAIREAAGEGRSDDVASIAEVTRRRFARHLQDVPGDESADPPVADRKPRRFAYPPNLYVVDGGAPQVNAASAVLEELGVTDVAVIGLAKRLEEVWVPGDPDPVILPRTSEGLYLLQRVRGHDRWCGGGSGFGGFEPVDIGEDIVAGRQLLPAQELAITHRDHAAAQLRLAGLQIALDRVAVGRRRQENDHRCLLAESGKRGP